VTIGFRHASARARAWIPARAQRIGWCAALALVMLAGPAAAERDPLEVKADMLFNIVKFVKWPDTATAPKGELTFAILGDDELASVIAATFSTRSVGGRQVFVRCIRRIEDARDCQVLYVATSETPRVTQVLETLSGKCILTTSDVPGFAAGGGMVNFVQDNERVRFEINPGSAERARLKISAKLLALARIVAESQ
jgi:hypothetical protein